ncbi:hypothetical protein Acor_65400 [Acrocarpospora corrugata]|uniref:Uncharacterized protein n=1 Tax=Acrocarpospora corrugata TaxID=35763 RepID=A0A5M3W8Z0_9ACTN|nr:hypothetical protein Acor_65400 [Acrocarpospora corrugata]
MIVWARVRTDTPTWSGYAPSTSASVTSWRSFSGAAFEVPGRLVGAADHEVAENLAQYADAVGGLTQATVT